MKSAKLEGYLNPDKLDHYTVGKMIAAVAEAMKDLPMSMATSAETVADDANAIVESWQYLGERGLELTKKIEKQEAALHERYDKFYAAVTSKRNEIAAKLDALPEMTVPNVPYGVNDMVNLAVKCSHLTDEQWQRVIDLAKSLAAPVSE